MSGQPSVPRIFDRSLLARHRVRAMQTDSIPDFLLERATDDLIDRLSVIKRTFPKVLNLGAAPGTLSRALRLVDGVELIVGTDLSSIGIDNHCDLGIVADEEALPFCDESFDLVISGLSLQYVNDLPGALAQIRRVLKPDGLFLATIAGGETLTELRQATLQAESDHYGGVSLRVAPFTDVRDLGGLLQRAGFALPVADADTVTVTYATALDLMRELKAMAASNVLIERRRVPMTQGLLLHIAEVYGQRFSERDGRIRATFELLTMTGWAPHESQQQPLRPGSAATRLADALGTNEVSVGDQADATGHNEKT